MGPSFPTASPAPTHNDRAQTLAANVDHGTFLSNSKPCTNTQRQSTNLGSQCGSWDLPFQQQALHQHTTTEHKPWQPMWIMGPSFPTASPAPTHNDRAQTL